MGILQRLGSVSAAGATFAANFWPWLLGAFLAGAAVAGWGAFIVGKLIYQGQALRAEKNLAEFDASLAKATAAGEAEAARRQAEALAAINARNRSTDEAVAAIPGQVAALLAPKFTALRETVNAPQYDCLRIPYPPLGLRLLERPGGLAPEDRGDPGRAAAPAVVPDAARARTP